MKKELRVGEWVQCDNCFQGLDVCKCPKETDEPYSVSTTHCDDCRKSWDSCMCKGSSAINVEEVIAQRKEKTVPTNGLNLAEQLRRTAKFNLDNKTLDQTRRLTDLIKESAGRAASEGKFNTTFNFRRQDYSWAAALKVVKILEDEGFECTLSQGTSNQNDSIFLDWAEHQ